MGAWAIASNIFYIPAAVRAFMLGAYSEGVLLSIITIVSTMWHTCQVGFCWGLPQGFLQKFDVFVSLSVFVLIAIYLMAFSKHELKAIAYIVGYILVFAIQFLDGSIKAIFVLLGVIIVVFLVRIFYKRETYPYADLDIADLIASAVFGVIGVILYVWLNDSNLIHGFWHLATALSAYFAIESLHHEWSLLFWKRKPRQSEPSEEPLKSPPETPVQSRFLSLADILGINE